MRAAVSVIFAAAFFWPVADALRSGRFHWRGMVVRRRSRPAAYWGLAAFNTFLSIATLAGGFGLLKP
jgi:hypothetical protein